MNKLILKKVPEPVNDMPRRFTSFKQNIYNILKNENRKEPKKGRSAAALFFTAFFAGGGVFFQLWIVAT